MLGLSPALRRYNRRILLLSLAYMVTLFAAVFLFGRHHLERGPVAWIAALLPALAVIGFFGAIGRYLVEETDEYLRDQMVRQSLIATGFAMSVATAWGFLENFRLVPHVYAYYAAILWFVGLALGALVNRLARGAAAC